MGSTARQLEAAASPQEDGELPLVVGRVFQGALEANAARLSLSSATILITGETGAGKSLAARFFFYRAKRYRRVFRPIALCEIPEHLFESQLFGHRRGAFTGADHDFEGKIAAANLGTLVLEDIAVLPLHLQTKLLRVIEDKEFERLGDAGPTKVDIRVIATTNVPLPDLVREGKFRKDLFYRLAVIPIRIPPLRERPEDVLPLATAYVRRIAHGQDKALRDLSPEAAALLASYPWPGNVRELIGELEYAVSMADAADELLTTDALSDRVRANLPDLPPEGGHLTEAVRSTERERIVQALVCHRGSRARAAKDLGISRRTLYNKLQALGIRF